MNPYRIYRDEWAKALTRQAQDNFYQTFVAMPFGDRFSYRPQEILDKIIIEAARLANKKIGDAFPRTFSDPKRVDDPTKGAIVITEEIISRILESHLFIADLTFQNTGVILETGIALATKPNQQVILITQGNLSEIHFDLRNNNVISYNLSDSVNSIADAFMNAAKCFEDQFKHNIKLVTRRISPEAILALNWYGQLQQQKGYSLHSGSRGPFFEGQDGLIRFDAATRELRDKELLWTDYAPGAIPGGDMYGMHATDLGWAVIENMWSDLRRKKPEKIDTGTEPGKPL